MVGGGGVMLFRVGNMGWVIGLGFEEKHVEWKVRISRFSAVPEL